MAEVRERQCHACKNQIEIYKNNIVDIIYYKKYFYHKSCFCKLAGEKSKSNRGKPADWQYALDNLSAFEDAAREQLEYPFIKDDLNDYLIENYNVVAVPDRFWLVTTELIQGKYKRKKCKPIPLKILFETWKWGQRKLNKINSDNKMANRGPSDDKERILYDLGVVVSKVPNYLAYKEKQKAAEIERERELKENVRIDYCKIANNTQRKDNNNFQDISSLVDDLF